MADENWKNKFSIHEQRIENGWNVFEMKINGDDAVNRYQLKLHALFVLPANIQTTYSEFGYAFSRV